MCIRVYTRVGICLVFVFIAAYSDWSEDIVFIGAMLAWLTSLPPRRMTEESSRVKSINDGDIPLGRHDLTLQYVGPT